MIPLVCLHNPSPLKSDSSVRPVASPSTAFNSQFKLSGGAPPLLHCTNATPGFAGSDVKFADTPAPRACENNTLAPSQLAGPRDQQRMWDPTLVWCLGQAAPVVPPVIMYTHKSCTSQCSLPLQKMLAAPALEALNCPQELVPCAETKRCSSQGCSNSSMC